MMLNAFCVLIWMEMIGRGSMGSVMIFLMENTQFAACGTVIILCVSMILLFLIGRIAPALVLNNSFFLILGTINHFKTELRGEPFLPYDLKMISEALGVLGNIFGSDAGITAPIAWGVGVMCVAVPLLFLGMRVMRGKGRRRIVCLLVSAAMLVGNVMFINNSPYMAGDNELNYIQNERDYNQRGFLVAFINRMVDFGTFPKPESYSRERVEQALEGYEPVLGEPEVKPDILFLMSESLFDLFGMLDLSEDPLAYFKQLQEQYWGGCYLTPLYGGGTVGAEYETLTGYRIQDTDGLSYMAPGSAMQDGMISMVSLLQSYGYYAQAIHPGERNYYSRTAAYKMLGFDSALFREDMDPVPQNDFPYPSDAYMFEQIIKAYENRPKDQPWFCHAITFQNHGGYEFESSLSQIRVNNDELDSANMLNVSNYVNLLKLSDDDLHELIAYFDAQENPVIIVMWGDHAPTLSWFGLPMPDSLKERMVSCYATPLLIYSNYDLDTSCLPQNISSYRLGACVLRMLGMDGDPYFNYLSADGTVNLTLFGGLIERDGEWSENAALYGQTEEELRVLHYDRLHGEQYGVKR